jgi:hypothetical protein
MPPKRRIATPSGWGHVQEIPSKRYSCGFCDSLVGSAKGFKAGSSDHVICLCPNCDCPTYIHPDGQVPAVAPGNEVAALPTDVEALYREARNSTSVEAYTAAVLACRKLLMNIAVAQGAEADRRFIEYVQFLADNGYVPPHGKHWVDHIRKKGNEATHEIALMTRQDAEELIAFSEMLLKFIFEFPSRVPAAASIALPEPES